MPPRQDTVDLGAVIQTLLKREKHQEHMSNLICYAGTVVLALLLARMDRLIARFGAAQHFSACYTFPHSCTPSHIAVAWLLCWALRLITFSKDEIRLSGFKEACVLQAYS